MKDLTKSLVLKRDKSCIICKLQNDSDDQQPSVITQRDPGGHDGGESSHSYSKANPPEPNGLHIHHEFGYYGHKASNIPLQNWPWRNRKEQMVVLCPTHHARRHQETHYSEIKIIRRHCYKLYPVYFSQFDVLGGT